VHTLDVAADVQERREVGDISVPEDATAGRRDWYRSMIDADPEQRARFERARERARRDPGALDDMDEIDRLLGGETV
jgi:hypothetical protein